MPLGAWCLVRGATAYGGLSVACGRGSGVEKGERVEGRVGRVRVSLAAMSAACVHRIDARMSSSGWTGRRLAGQEERTRPRLRVTSKSMALSGEGEAEMPVVVAVAVAVGGVRGGDASTYGACGWLTAWLGWMASVTPFCPRGLKVR